MITWRETIYIIIYLILIIIVCIIYSTDRIVKLYNDDPIIEWKTNGTGDVVLIFGTSDKELISNLIERGYRVVVSSRRASKIADIRAEIKQPFDWIQSDVRLTRDLERLFKMVKDKYGKIDIVINTAFINSNFNLLETSMSSERDDTDIFLKLPGAYEREYTGALSLYRKGAPGSEMGFFTNIIGMINITRLAVREDVRMMIHQKIDNEIYRGIMSEFLKNSSGRTTIVSSLTTDIPQII